MERDLAIAIVKSSGLKEHADAVIARLRPSARITVQEGHQPDSDGSHFGGSPRLPIGTEWPRWDNREVLRARIASWEERLKARPGAGTLQEMLARERGAFPTGPVPLMFLGQIDLRQVALAGTDEADAMNKSALLGWPTEGSLAFFAHPDAAGFDPRERGACRVVYSPPSKELRTVMPPDDLAEENCFARRALRFHQEWTLPASIDLGGESPTESWEDGPYREVYYAIMSDDPMIHRCGGHAQPVQDDMELECQLVTNGIYCGGPEGYRDPRRAALEAGAKDWRLLLQIDSDDKLGWMWGDVGRLYFWIRQHDLDARHFDNCWFVQQCH